MPYGTMLDILTLRTGSAEIDAFLAANEGPSRGLSSPFDGWLPVTAPRSSTRVNGL